MDYEFHDGTFRRIGKFVDVRRISRFDGGDASGGFGTTYIAYHPSLGRHVVLKEFFPGQIAERDTNGLIRPQPGFETTFYELREKFLTEAQTLASCKFNYVVAIFDDFEFGSEANVFMVMDLVQDSIVAPGDAALADKLYRDPVKFPDRAAPTLEEVVHYQKPDFAQFLATFHRLLDAVHNIHSKGIYHRDIKPSNVMMPLRRAEGRETRYERHPVLIDFGASRKATSGAKRSTSVIYTPGYAPPEQTSLHGAEGACTDIFALAATAYYALSGRHPDEAMLGDGSGRGSGYFMAAVGGACTPEFAAAMEWALHLDPAKRPQSVQQWRSRLPDLTPQVAHQGWSRRQIVLGASGVAGLAVAGGLGVVAVMPGVPATVVTAVRKFSAEPSAQIGITSEGFSGQIAMSAAGAVLAGNETSSDAYHMVGALLGKGSGMSLRAMYRSTTEPSMGLCALPLDDGGMVVGGFAGYPDSRALLVRVGNDGKEVWSRSPDAGSINRMAIADNRIHVVCGSPDATDAATRAKLHIYDLNGGEIGNGIDLSVKAHESVSRVATLDNERIVTISQRIRPNGLPAGVVAGYRINGGESSDLWKAVYSDEKWLDDNKFKMSQPHDVAVINGEVFVTGVIANAQDQYSPYLLRLDGTSGELRWAKARPYGDETYPIIPDVSLAVANAGGQTRLYAAYCPPEPDGSFRRSRVVQVGPDGEALATTIIGTVEQPFRIQSLAFDTGGGVAFGFLPNRLLLVRHLTWDS